MTIPNPFDDRAVKEHLSEKARLEADKTAGAGSAQEPAPTAGDDLSPAEEMAVMIHRWANQSPEAVLEAVTEMFNALNGMAALLGEGDAADYDQDDLVTALEAGKNLRDAGAAFYNAARTLLWDKCLHRPGKYTTEAGVKFTWRRPNTRTTVDQKVLATYPEAYNASVKKVEPAPGAVGILKIG